MALGLGELTCRAGPVRWEVTHPLNKDIHWGLGKEPCLSPGRHWFPKWCHLGDGTQWPVFLAGPRQESSVRQVLTQGLQIEGWGEAPKRRQLTRAGQSRLESPPYKLSSG